MLIRVKRIYEDRSSKDGVRILTDRLWPRGVSKEAAHLDEWLKELGPSTELRKWFKHDPEKFTSFKEKYRQELQENEAQKEALNKLKEIARHSKQDITLLFAAKNEQSNHTVILKEILEGR